MKARALLLATGTLFCGALLAAPTEQRVRGEIVSVSPDAMVVRTLSGADVSLALNASTQYLQVVRSSLDKIEPGSYVGTATKNVGSTQVALEVGIFPPEMRGANQGHVAWDRLPDTVSGTTPVASMMTNGSVSAVATPSRGGVETTMTNGAVSASASRNGVKQLTVTYTGGEQTILVPPSVPVVAFRPGTKSDVSKGVFVFVDASEDGGSLTAKLVAAGIGEVKPPF